VIFVIVMQVVLVHEPNEAVLLNVARVCSTCTEIVSRTCIEIDHMDALV
jgi:hypothetical protein